MDKQEALNKLWQSSRAFIAPGLANEMLALWRLKPVVGERASKYQRVATMLCGQQERVVSVDEVALKIAAKLGCPKFENPMTGVGSAAEWNGTGACAQIALKECLELPGLLVPGLAWTLRRAGTYVPDIWVQKQKAV